MKSLKTLGAVALLSTSMLGAATSFAASTDYQPEPGTAETPVKTKFKVSDDNTSNEKPENPDNGQNPDGNKPLNPKGPFGIAYIPSSFTTTHFEDGESLNESGEQKFDFKNTNMHVGVKDKTHTKGGWTLTAKLDWNGNKKLLGSSIDSTNTGVQINKGESGSSVNYEKTTDVTSASSLKINESATPVMTGQNLSDKVYNNTFDLGLKDAKLVVPDVSQVEEGTYEGTVTWTLTASPLY